MAKLTQEQLIEKYEQLSEFEKIYLSKGIDLIAGIDEAGRGPLAGPVVAAACILDPSVRILGLDDSKKLTEKKREALFPEIKEKALAYSVVRVEADVIDEINILNATKKAMRQCVEELKASGHCPGVLLIDAVDLDGTGIEVVPIIKGDARSNSIAAASVLAKVTRDHIMTEYDSVYPGYGFAKHKGYGTKDHYTALRELGMSPIHRRSFLKVMH
ncbi:MAG: ribonuclease HII [Clostridiales bacterium]|nr:ribonuclease HII [Clostridiales bacterium]